MDTKKIIKLASKFGDKKGRHPYFHAKHYEGGYIVATDARTIAKCRFDYPDSQEGKTFDNASGREVKKKYPPYNGIFTPYRSEAGNELIPVTIDRKKAGAVIKTVQALPGAEVGAYVSINVTGKTVYFNSAEYSKILAALDLYGIDTIYFRAENLNCPVYAKADDGSEFVIMPVVNLHSDAVLCLNGEQDTELLKEKAAATVEQIKAEEETMEQIPDKFSADAAKSDRMIQKLKKRLSIIQAAIDASTERDTETAGETCEVSTSATPTGQKTINTPTCPERAERLDEGDASICTNEPEEATGKPDGCPDAAERPDDTEILDGTTADDIDRRMLARIRENTEKRKKNPAQWMMERSHPMTIDEVAADGSADYCVYTRRDRGGRFSRATYAGIPGEDAAYITKKMIGECNDGTGHDFAISLRHRTKGIVYEWFWSAEKARRADIELENKVAVPPEPEETPPEAAKRKAGAPKRPIVTNIVPRLRDAIIRETGRQARALIKHLEACEIFDWPALMGKDGIYTLRDELRETCAPSSARTYMATMKGFLARHDEERGVCKDYRKILKNKADKAVKTWLNKRELEAVEAVEGLSPTESLVRARFLIGAYTGMRISDAMDVSESNVSGGMMTYVAKKTGTEATVPCPEKVMRLISYVQANDQYISLMTYNKLLKKICYKAKVFAKVKTHTAGETKEGPKWLFVSSHTARISFATNLANAGVPLVQLAGMMGHTSTTMTERYIVNKSVNLSERAMEYFA
jgi:integrase